MEGQRAKAKDHRCSGGSKVARKAGRPRGWEERKREERLASMRHRRRAWAGLQGLWVQCRACPWVAPHPLRECWPAALPDQESGPTWPGLPSVAKVGHRGLLTHGPTLHCQPRPSLVVDRGCWAEGSRLQGCGWGATRPAKLVLEARLVCGDLWVLFLVEEERLVSANLGRMVKGGAKAGSRVLSQWRV